MKNHCIRFLYFGALFVILTFLASCSAATKVDPELLNGDYMLIMTVKEINDPQDIYSVNNIMIGEARGSEVEINLNEDGSGRLYSETSSKWEVEYKNGEFRAHLPATSALDTTLTGTVSKDENGAYTITGTWCNCDDEVVVLSGTFEFCKEID